MIGKEGFENNGSGVGLIGTVVNSGTISGTLSGTAQIVYGILNTGTISSLVNTGLITAAGGSQSYAISNVDISYQSSKGMIGTLTNSGTINGNILNGSNALNLAGGTSGYGTFSGGTIYSTISGVSMVSGNIVLADQVNMGANTLTNSGASLKIASAVTITGNYSQTAGGLIVNESTGSVGSLKVTGAANISGTGITVTGTGLAAGQSYTIANAGTLTTSNDTFNAAGGGNTYAATGTVSGGALIVTLGTISGTVSTSTSFSAVGAAYNPRTRATGALIDTINNGTSPAAIAFQNTVIAKLNALTAAQQGAALKQLGAQSSGGVPIAAPITATATSGAVESRTLSLLSHDPAERGAAAGSEAISGAGWGQVLGGYQARNAADNATGYTGSSFGVIAGYDRYLDPDTTVGLAVSSVKASTSGSGSATGQSTTVISYQVTAYASRRFGPAFIDAQAGLGYNQFTESRTIDFLSQSASASYSGVQGLTRVGGGYDLAVANGVVVTPLAGLRTVIQGANSYQETGSSADQSVSSSFTRSVTQDVGFKVASRVTTAMGTLTPEARLAWVHDYAGGAVSTSGVMGGASYTSTSNRVSQDGITLNAASGLDAGNNIGLRAEYDGEIRHDYQSHSAVIKVTIGF